MAEDVAREYMRTEKWKRPKTARALIDDIERYLASKGLGRSSISRHDIAEHVIELQRQELQPVTPSDQAAFDNDIAQGISDQRPELDAMAQLGTDVARNTASHLFRL